MKTSELQRTTNALCPSCKKGFIVDQRAAYLDLKDMPYWICSNSLKECNYRFKNGKDWQWASWDWEQPHFITILETNKEKLAREAYEQDIKKRNNLPRINKKATEKINKNLRICRVCGKRDCELINNCL